MVQLRWIGRFVIAMLLLLTAVTGQMTLTLRAGVEATLPCGEKKSPGGCTGTSWQASRYEGEAAKQLVNLGSPKFDRLSLTANCSLVIKNVTAEDAGKYTCIQYDGMEKPIGNAEVHLSVVDITERRDPDKVSLTCSVSTYSSKYTVKWFYSGQDVGKFHPDFTISQQSRCTVTVTFYTNHYITSKKDYDLLKCHITSDDGKVEREFAFSDQTSADVKKDEDEDKSTNSEQITGAMGKNWWWYVLVAVGAAALLMIVVAGVRCRRTKARSIGNDGLTSKSAVTQCAADSSQDTADPEYGIHYTTVSYTKKADGKARVRGKHDEGGDTVTYSMVKVSARVSEDPSNLYATVDVPNK